MKLGDHPRTAAEHGNAIARGRVAHVADLRDAIHHGRRRRQLLAGDRGELAETLLAQARLFNAVLPWSPVQGACLFQATLLLEFLAARGLAADWVFGVRTWPFSAHCWVQAGGAVLNDTVERVAPYRQILRV